MRRRRLLRAALAGAAATATAACTPRMIPMGPPVGEPSLAGDALVMADGARLPLHRWLPPGGRPPRAVILALHGFNEYARSFAEDPAPLFTAAGVAVYAYDQRGFGQAPHRGIWAGAETLAHDAATAARLIRARHPGVPLVLLGESMGASVIMVAAASAEPPPVDGYVLLAPAVWGRSTMPALVRWILDAAARTIPLVAFRNTVGGITPTDNIERLQRWSRDPLIIRETRVDAAKGLVDLMDEAVAAAPRFGTASPRHPPTLLLYGARDQLVPAGPTRRVLRSLPASARARVGYYAEGHHQLLRDRNGPAVVRDILAWIEDPTAPLPSGADEAAQGWIGEAA
ncbi:alpha/beta hydrolase [Caldovatus sediminis]|uniref:Alpha/beta hydrolase n=1 Tax=Caldovatus sediminis TaxID=2041189 RepID=A0A8J2ZCT7_9PROT|nr:alpha/beta fold hydrolase [Caldovatus sediminis]GGG39839.1 alpha/beta hydrolase [Caldovatus sediminis]